MMPNHDFVMVGANALDATLEFEIKHEADSLKNLKYLGHLSFERVEKLFDETSVFINTSIPGCEGFPNTFFTGMEPWNSCNLFFRYRRINFQE